MVGSANDIERPWNRIRLRAPQDSPGWLERPPLDRASEVVQQNAEIWNSPGEFIDGVSLRDFRRRCRQDVVDAAVVYARALGWSADRPEHAVDRPWFVTGHQPVLAHPGVWAKNFVVHDLARQHNGVALNLIVDNDLLTSGAVSLPARHDDRLMMQSIPFAADLARMPWEEARIEASETFIRFGKRVAEAMREWQIDSLINAYWPAVIERMPRTRNLADLFSAARHEIERRWGVNTLELPISRLCGLPSFHAFAAHLLLHATEFAEVYNYVLTEYRRLYRIRSNTHPVPALDMNEQGCEAPFWIWREGEHQRRRLFVQQRDGGIMLSDGREAIATCERDSAAIAEALRKVSSRGYRLRTRALTTTMFARLAIGDLFVHGIGGAQYDEMTDRIINRFFGIAAPQFFTVTSTLHLPLEPVLGSEQRIGRNERGDLIQQLRELEYNPDRFLKNVDDDEIASLVAEKRDLCRQQNAVDRLTGQTTSMRRRRRAENHRRYHRLREINARLEPFVADRKAEVTAALHALADRAREQRIRFHREFAVWLYPESELRRLYARFLPRGT